VKSYPIFFRHTFQRFEKGHDIKKGESLFKTFSLVGV